MWQVPVMTGLVCDLKLPSLQGLSMSLCGKKRHSNIQVQWYVSSVQQYFKNERTITCTSDSYLELGISFCCVTSIISTSIGKPTHQSHALDVGKNQKPDIVLMPPIFIRADRYGKGYWKMKIQTNTMKIQTNLRVPRATWLNYSCRLSWYDAQT